MRSKIGRTLSIIISVLLMASQASIPVLANEAEVSNGEALEEKENEIIETEEPVEDLEENFEGMDETKEEGLELAQIDEYSEDNKQETFEDSETVEPMNDDSSETDRSDEEGDAVEDETFARWEQKKFDDCIVITEGSYENYVGENEKVVYSFTPDETGMYLFHSFSRSGYLNTVHCFDSHNDYRNGKDGLSDCKVIAGLKAGETYYYETYWYYSYDSGDMQVTLEKYSAPVITEDKYTAHLDKGENVVYSFTPDENGWYMFRSNANQASRAELYDSGMLYDFQGYYRDSLGHPNFSLVAGLQAGVTYYFEISWYSSSYSEDMEFTVEKYTPTEISEGTYTVQIEGKDRAVYSFTPNESGFYMLRNNDGNDSDAGLYDSNLNCLQIDFGIPTFKLLEKLKAGESYYFEVYGWRSNISSDIEITLERYDQEIFEGTYTIQLDKEEKLVYRFTPDESDLYAFRCKASTYSNAYLYDSNFTELKFSGTNYNYSLLENLKAGETYYFGVYCMNDSYSGEMEITLEKNTKEISEGTHTFHIYKGEKPMYSFTPVESGLYVLYSNASQENNATLYDSSYNSLQSGYGHLNFWLVASLEAGATYYCEIYWRDTSYSGDMEFTLEKYGQEMITEGTRTFYLEKGKRAVYKFTPAENDLYVLRSNASQNVSAHVYGSNHEYLHSDHGNPNFSLIRRLQAGKTYYFEIERYNSISDDIEITLERYTSTEITEGTQTVHIGAGENAVFSFTPVESNLYTFSSKTSQNSHVELYNSDTSMKDLYGVPNFWMAAYLDAGVTYYYEVSWESYAVSDDMEVTLEKYDKEITEGTYAIRLKTGEKAVYSFTPKESGMYVIHSNSAEQAINGNNAIQAINGTKGGASSDVCLYDHNNYMLKYAMGYPDFQLSENLEAGETYYYEIYWYSYDGLDLTEFTLEKYGQEIAPIEREFGFSTYQGKKYWYENWQRQGVYGDPKNIRDEKYGELERGREIYDPESDGWYWLDAVYDGAAAIGKEVWIPYIYQDELSWQDEEVRQNANNADSGMADYTYKCMKEHEGKWVRYDENGRMLKGWVIIEGRLAELYPDQAGNTYYYDHMTGLMAKGDIVIDGTLYHFDEVTGVKS